MNVTAKARGTPRNERQHHCCCKKQTASTKRQARQTRVNQTRRAVQSFNLKTNSPGNCWERDHTPLSLFRNPPPTAARPCISPVGRFNDDLLVLDGKPHLGPVLESHDVRDLLRDAHGETPPHLEHLAGEDLIQGLVFLFADPLLLTLGADIDLGENTLLDFPPLGFQRRAANGTRAHVHSSTVMIHTELCRIVITKRIFRPPIRP